MENSKEKHDLAVPVSWGELLDKVTILEIKTERITDPLKLKNVGHELELLNSIKEQLLNQTAEVSVLIRSLKAINNQLWEIEDEIRECERKGDFGSRFVELARAVYKTNDRRAEVKYQLNGIPGSEVVEEKSYEKY